VVELLRRAAEEGGVSLVGILMDVAAARLDPPERARAYAEAALELLREAEAELARGRSEAGVGGGLGRGGSRR
jgi:hypothetical protein